MGAKSQPAPPAATTSHRCPSLSSSVRRRRRRCCLLPATALRRHVSRDFGGPFQDGSLVVAMQDLPCALPSSTATVLLRHRFCGTPFFRRFSRRGPRIRLFPPSQLRICRPVPSIFLLGSCLALETLGIAMKDILLSQPCPRISLKSLFRMRSFPFPLTLSPRLSL